MKSTKHNTCEEHQVQVNWSRTNNHGNPALECLQCKDKKQIKNKFICWLSAKEAKAYETLEMDFN